ncbi:hypothetical protein FACS1894147_08720 [Spirochaetia bacterium]|nr:hypothetical protein FACS1894147_08720 [Spirochaetia bacterium]
MPNRGKELYMKKDKLFLLGMLAVMLTFGLLTVGCASGPKATAFYERGDYTEFSPTAVLNITHPEKIMTTSERESKNSGGSSSLLGALAKAVVSAAKDAIAVDLDEDAIGAAGSEMVREGFAKAGIPLVDKDTVYNAPGYEEYMDYARRNTSNGKATYANKYAEPFAQSVGAKGFARASWDIEIASGGLLDGVNVYPKVTLVVTLYNEKGQQVAPSQAGGSFDLKFEGNFDKAVKPLSKSGKGPTAEIDSRYVWTEGTPMVLGQFDKDVFTEMTLRAMQMCVDKFVEYVEKGKQDFPGTYKGKK